MASRDRTTPLDRARIHVPPNGAALVAIVTGALGAGLSLGPKVIYGFALASGVLAVTFALLARERELREPAVGGGRLALLGAVLGIVAIGLGTYKGVTLEEADDSAATSSANELEAYCMSEAGDALLRVSGAGLADAEALRSATDEALDIADDAPAGAYCAVNALNAIADTWNVRAGDPDYEDAEDQVARIRELQDERDLRQAQF